MAQNQESSKYWSDLAQRVQYSVNFFWWIERIAPYWVAVNVIFCLLFLLFRHNVWEANVLWMSFAGTLLAIAVIAFFKMRSVRYQRQDALLRLEHFYRLNNQLTAADAGITDWPEPPLHSSSPFDLRLKPIYTPFLISFALLIAGLTIPIGQSSQAAQNALDNAELPVPLTQLNEWVETLKEEPLLQEEALEDLESKTAELMKQKPQDWYSQSGLEASEHLRDKTRNALENLSIQLEKTNTALDIARDSQQLGLSPETMDALQNEFLKNLNAIDSNMLPLDSKLLNRLKGLDLKNLNALANLSAEDLAKLQKQLSQCSGKAGQCSGLGEGDFKMISEAMKMAFCSGGLIPGYGYGVGRGPGEAPMYLTDEATGLSASKTEAVSNQDLSRIALGDLLEVKTRPGNQEDTPFQGVQAVDTQFSNGEGGDAVWTQQLTPQEKQLLQNYFK